ncbi:hypothetical protein F511_25120 [Dorcoceras hygrometricum]|uniref:Uncharacterized protein n=1 Tax=Dorcoceras hygrometricum TaxID=472368 RepID=A0A2Z7DG86_9LAMI|nr:hypothetical protein F511_25120 [Dorcoceras hygrometricum]
MSELFARFLIAFALGDVAERMGKAAMLKALKGHLEEGSSRAIVPPSIKKRKRKTLPAEKDVRRSMKKKGASTSEMQPDPTTEKHRAPMLPSSSHEACPTVNPEGPSAIRAKERRAAEARREALEAEKKALEAEKEVLAIEKDAMAAELADARARAEEEMKGLLSENEHLKDEAENAWSLDKEFLKSSEFDDLCVQKSLDYFKCGFKGYLAQFRANGYTEEEHPTPFLSVARALEDLPDDEEEADEGASSDEASSPNSPVL